MPLYYFKLKKYILKKQTKIKKQMDVYVRF